MLAFLTADLTWLIWSGVMLWDEPPACWAIFWMSETICGTSASPWMWIVVGPVDVGRALVGDVGQPGRRVDAELLQERGGVLLVLDLRLALCLLVALLEPLEQRRPTS